MAIAKGKVFLVGAGPGDPALITRKGEECLRKAEVVIYDRLVSRELLYLAPENAELIYVGKRAGEHFRKQNEINQILLDKAREGKILVRLKGGDPFVFGRGGEEALELEKAGIPFEIVPGVTAAVATSAYAGIPLTHRDWTSSVAMITGHEAPQKVCDPVCWEEIGRCVGTIAVYMGVKNFESITHRIIDGGRDAQTPAAVIHAGTTPWQKVVTGPLDSIASIAQDSGIKPPAMLIVGDVVRLREKLAWHEKRPLFGKRLAVTRSRSPKSLLAEELRSRGSMVIEFPTIKIVPQSDPESLFRSLEPLSQYEWIIFSSPTGVEHFFSMIVSGHGDSRNLSGTKIAARDSSTARSLRKYGIHADFQNKSISTESMVKDIIKSYSLKDKKVLIPQKTEMLPNMVSLFVSAGAHVHCEEVYHITNPDGPPPEFLEHVAENLLDGICFTSSASVINFCTLLDITDLAAVNNRYHLFSIGPITSDKIREYNGTVALEAEKHSIVGLADAVSDYYTRS